MSLFNRFSKLTLIFTLLVTFAGGFVRMTGSGMGCPDWPKCFGLVIPPTSEDQLQWEPNTEYDKGQMIIVNEQLLVCQKDLKTTDQQDLSNWKKYEKHDYAKFNAAHTWTEYINRLCGVLLGIFSLLMLVGAIIDKNGKKILLSLIVVMLISFEGWLGMKVVETVLKPVVISAHMLVALIILVFMVKIRVNFFEQAIFRMRNRPKLMALILVCLFLSVLQILLGTQVREGMQMASQVISERSEWFSIIATKFWMDTDTSYLSLFYIHRTSSLLIIALNYWLYNMLKPFFRYNQLRKFSNLLMYVLIGEVLSGAIMYYINIPGLMQLIHLMLSAFMFGLQAYLFIVIRTSRPMKITPST